MKRVRIQLDVIVHDEDMLFEYAERRVRACWQESLENISPGRTVEGAVYEALIASNENPSPMDYGIELDGVVLTHIGG
jgi:hypothetical protein